MRPIEEKKDFEKMNKTEKTYRFQKMKQLPEIGPSGMEVLKNSHVTVIGVGGLGCPVILYLASMGVGHIHLVDNDVVEESNLSRQILFGEGDIGRLKTEVAREYILRYHPHTAVTYSNALLDLDLALRIFPATDVIVDASDNFQTNYLISDVGQYLNKTVVYGAATQWSGRAAVFGGSNRGCLRCIYESPSLDKIGNCSVEGVISAMTGMVGTFQASEVIKVLLSNTGRQRIPSRNNFIGQNACLLEPSLRLTIDDLIDSSAPQPTPYLHIFDMLRGSFLNIRWNQRKNCFCHSPHLDFQNKQDLKISCEKNELRKNERLQVLHPKEVIVLDVREVYEEEFRFNEVLDIPLSVLDHTDLDLPKSSRLDVICASGQRAKLAVSILKKAGFVNARAYPGDIESFYKERGIPSFRSERSDT